MSAETEKPPQPPGSPPLKKNGSDMKSVDSRKASTSERRAAGWFGWMRKSSDEKPGPRKNSLSIPKPKRSQSNPHYSPNHADTTTDRKKKSWGWWSDKQGPPSSTQPPDKPAFRKSKSVSTSSNPPPPTQIDRFQEIKLDSLDIYSQRREFKKELVLLREKYESSDQDADAKELAKLKIDTLQDIVNDMVLYREPPEDVMGHAYTFWIMETIKQTMQKSGGFISPALYVPQRVWLQEGGKIVAYHLKMDVCSKLLKNILDLEADFIFNATDISRLIQRLKGLTKWMENVREIISFQLAEVKGKEDSSKKKSTWTAFAKGTAQLRNYALPTRLSPEESLAYSACLTAIFQKCKFLRELLTRYSMHEELCILLGGVMAFFRGVILVFVLHDLNKLINQYHAASAKTFLAS
ncbi:hypothetical protein AAMO2058_001039100 [Amorphochlora amoebiformis]